MLFNFNTDNVKLARAALILYAMYKSRDTNSPMNGVDTWNRVESYCVGACKKSRTTSEFVTKFKELGKVGAIKPRYLGEHSSGSYSISAESVAEFPDAVDCHIDLAVDYHIDLFEDNDVRKTIENDYPLVVLLVRERIQREKYAIEENENEED